MKTTIRIELIPLYRCNENCNFCLYQHEKNNKNTADLAWIDSTLTSLHFKYDILQIKITGGEISLLSDFYFEMLFNLLKIHCKKIIVETNFVEFKKALINNCDIINIGYNFNNNPLQQQIFNNIKAATATGKSINIKSLDIFCKINHNQIINHLNSLKIKSWEIIPFHQTPFTLYKFRGYSEYEKIVAEYLKLSNKMKFAFQNKLQLENILNLDNYNVKTVYLTPNNKLALQNFDNDNNFFLEEFDNVEDLSKKMKEMEKKKDKFCEKCTSKLQCMANSFMNLNYTGLSCSGFKDLINKHKGGL